MDYESAIRAASRAFYDAANAIQHGDAGPMLALWSNAEDVAYADPAGGIQRGRDALRAYWERAASLNQANPGAVRAEHDDLAVGQVGDLAYVLTRERIAVTRDGTTTRLVARATNVFRREGGAWRMAYRHAEAPQPEPGAASGVD